MKHFFLALMIVGVTALQAQYKSPYFNLINVDNGLPEANVSSLLQDKYGYLWFGTGNGLVRYDGYQMRSYPIRNKEGVPVNPTSVLYLFEDSKGTLWTYISLEGLYFLDRKKDVFTKVNFGKEGEELVRKMRPNNWIEDTRRGLIWMEVFNTELDKNVLCLFDPADHTLTSYHNKAAGKNFIPSYKGAGVTIDVAGNTWIIADSLLCYFDPATRTAKPYFVLPDPTGKASFISIMKDPTDPALLWLNTNQPAINGTEPKIVRNIFRFNTKTKAYSFSAPGSSQTGSLPVICFHTFTDSLKRVWFSTEKGIALYDGKSGRSTLYPLTWPDTTMHAEEIRSDKDGNLWVAGSSSGLYFIDIRNATTKWISSDNGPGSLPFYSNGRLSPFVDRSGTLWIIIPGEGIAWRDRYKTQFAPVPVNPYFSKAGTETRPHQFNILGSVGDSICFIADTTGMFAWNTLNNKFDPIDLKDKQLYKTVMSVTADKNGNLWMAAQLNGLIQYNTASKTITRYQQATDSLAPIFTIAVAADKEGIIWIGSADKGLLRFDPAAKRFTNYPYVVNDGTRKVKDSLDDRVALSLYFDRQGILWIGTGSGSVNSLNTQTGKFRSYLNFQEGFFAINSIFEDSHRRLWVTSNLSGLFLLDRETGQLKRYTEKDGLIYNAVYSVVEDGAGNIWAATAKGMSRIDPVKNIISNFPAARPVSFLFFVNPFLDRNGILRLPARNGLLSFNPLQLDESNVPARVLIESVGYRSAGRSADTLLYTEGRDRIKLSYDENRVSFQFVALHFADPSQNQYAYRLEGYDKDWVKAGTQHSVTYTNLSPGTYVFYVKAANSDGIWNETGASFTIVITPPWWKTWWAYCLFAILLIGGLWTFIRYRSRALIREKELLEQKVEHRTKQLKESIENLKSTQTQLIQSEKMASLGELTAGIAHEIQNPLNFVNNFSEVNIELIEEAHEALSKNELAETQTLLDNLKENEEKIRFHGKRADGIVKSMLQHSRSGSGQKEPTDINALCDEYLRLAYHGLRAKDKSFNATFNADLDPALGKVNVQPQDLGRVVLNLINNAFYAVTERKKKEGAGYEPKVTVTTKRNKDNIEIAIKDNGTGIPQKVMEKIFQPFFTTKPAGDGTGLGLSLSYDIVTNGHGGKLSVETKEGEGTTFTILLT